VVELRPDDVAADLAGRAEQEIHHGDGQPEEARMSSPSVTAVVRFLGLSELVETAGGDQASFPLGVLYPYSPDLQRVCARFDAVLGECPDAAPMLLGEAPGEVRALSSEQLKAVTSYLESIATLYSRIAFAPGPAGVSVGTAHKLATDAIARTTRPTKAKAEVGAP
jgi:hypothetical protein